MCCGLEEGLGTPLTHQCPPSVPTRRKDAGQASALLSPRPSCAQPVALLLDLTGVTSEMMATAVFALVVSISLLIPHHQAQMWPWTSTSRQGGHPAPFSPSLGTVGAHFCTAHAGACALARSLAELLRTTVTPERDHKLQRPLSSVLCPSQAPTAQLHHPGLFPHTVLTFACVLVQAQHHPYNTLLVPLLIQGLSPVSWGPQQGRMKPWGPSRGAAQICILPSHSTAHPCAGEREGFGDIFFDNTFEISPLISMLGRAPFSTHPLVLSFARSLVVSLSPHTELPFSSSPAFVPALPLPRGVINSEPRLLLPPAWRDGSSLGARARLSALRQSLSVTLALVFA